MGIHFDCTRCGRCCRDLKLPLSIDEAIGWLARGGTVGLFCEAIPWTPGTADDPWMRYKGERAFAAVSGNLAVRILVTLIALHDGPCPFLGEDLLCRAYAERPRVCRIYPAEINPLVEMAPNAKLCPPDAWSGDRPLFVSDGVTVDGDIAALIAQARAASVDDAEAKGRLCAALAIHVAALANEGFAVHRPPSADLLAALRACRDDAPSQWSWRIASNRGASRALLGEAGAEAMSIAAGDAFIAFFPDE